MSALARLARQLREDGGLLAAHVAADPSPGGGDRLPVEAIREGYLLHYASGRVVVTGDPDLALLAGDRLYALGLAELARAGDLAGVRAMAKVIGEAAAAHGAGDPQAAAAAWEMAHTEGPPAPPDR